MWLAHALTLSRFPIAIGLTQTYGNAPWSVALIVLAALTDALDGNVARWMQRRGHTRPDIGGWLDPLVDKIFVVIVLATIWFHTRDVVLIALIAAREIVLVPLVIVYLVRKQPTSHLHADAIGKAATIAQFLACAVAVAEPEWALPVAVVAAVLGLAAVVHYIVRERRVAITTVATSGSKPRHG
jgi:phosphatidylglycerophosphate synthase